MDYVRWIFKLDFCTSRYLIIRELGLEKLKVRWGIRALKFEKKIRGREEDNLLKICWNKKMSRKKKDLYSRKKEKYFNRNGWALEAIEEWRNKGLDIIGMIIRKENDIQKQGDESRIVEERQDTIRNIKN